MAFRDYVLIPSAWARIGTGIGNRHWLRLVFLFHRALHRSSVSFAIMLV